MNGIIIVNKEKGMTSHDVINRIRKIFNTKRVGHLGTLDPLASGVLVICINEATKLVQFLINHDKEYVARICLGKMTDTYDLEGKVIEQVKVSNIDEQLADKTIESFLGKQLQMPPIYSSIKVHGKKLYEYARKNEEVDVMARQIEIYDIKRISPYIYQDDCCYFDLAMKVSKGTYIRSLCVDIGKKMGFPSLMFELRRQQLGPFTISESYTLTDIEKGNYRLIKMIDALKDLPMVCDDELVKKASFGMPIPTDKVMKNFDDTPLRIVICDKDELVAIYDLERELNYYKAIRVWN